jgi:hypothetical protein
MFTIYINFTNKSYQKIWFKKENIEADKKKSQIQIFIFSNKFVCYYNNIRIVIPINKINFTSKANWFKNKRSP